MARLEAAAVPILQEHKAYLEASLRNQGLTLGSFDQQQGRREEQAPLPTPSGPSMAVAGSPALASSGQESPPPVAAVAARSSRIEFVA